MEDVKGKHLWNIFKVQFPKIFAPMFNYENPVSEFLPSSTVTTLTGLSVLIIRQWKAA